MIPNLLTVHVGLSTTGSIRSRDEQLSVVTI